MDLAAAASAAAVAGPLVAAASAAAVADRLVEAAGVADANVLRHHCR